MSVQTTILGLLDRVARGREAQRAAFTGGTDFWDRVDAAADETYENRVKGASITAIDAALPLGGGWGTSTLKKLFTLHDEYFGTDLGLSGTARLETWLASVGRRVGVSAAVAHEEAMGVALGAAVVGPPGVRPADEATPTGSGMHLWGTLAAGGPTWSAGDGALASTVGPGGALAINLGAAQTVGATFRCTWGTGGSDYKDLALSLSMAAQYTQTILGAEDVASGAAAGQADVAVAATAAFAAGMQVLIWESDALQQVATVLSLVTDTSLTMTADLVETFTTDAVVIPLWRSVAYQSGATGSGDVAVYALPDRTLSL